MRVLFRFSAFLFQKIAPQLHELSDGYTHYPAINIKLIKE